MSNQTPPQKLGYGYVSDSDNSLQSKSGGKFGGNFGNALLSKIQYNSNTAKEGQPVREAIEIEVKVIDKEYKDWISPVTKVYDSNSNEITDVNSAAYIEGFNLLITQQNAVFTHYLKSVGVDEQAIKNLFINVPVTSFADYAQRMLSLLPPNYASRPIDLFLEFQWDLGKKQDGTPQDRTFLTLPRNMKGGYFIVSAQPGTWTEEKGADGSLKYKNQSGAEHPFSRNANFMISKKAYQQGGDSTQPGAAPGTQTAQTFAPGNGAAQTSTWNVPPPNPAAGTPAQ